MKSIACAVWAASSSEWTGRAGIGRALRAWRSCSRASIKCSPRCTPRPRRAACGACVQLACHTACPPVAVNSAAGRAVLAQSSGLVLALSRQEVRGLGGIRVRTRCPVWSGPCRGLRGLKLPGPEEGSNTSCAATAFAPSPQPRRRLLGGGPGLGQGRSGLRVELIACAGSARCWRSGARRWRF